MIRKLIILLAVIVGTYYTCSAQGIYRINLNVTNSKAFINSVEVMPDNVDICISTSGKILMNAIASIGLDYWTLADGDYRQGKLKSYGGIPIDYYENNNTGKVKSIGDVRVTYYNVFDGPDNIGRLKSIGYLIFTYYDRFDGTDNIGKLKSIGDNKITYYDKFDGPDNIGKLKTIDNTIITYYDRFDPPEKLGLLKQINGDNPYLNIRHFENIDADND